MEKEINSCWGKWEHRKTTGLHVASFHHAAEPLYTVIVQNTVHLLSYQWIACRFLLQFHLFMILNNWGTNSCESGIQWLFGPWANKSYASQDTAFTINNWVAKEEGPLVIVKINLSVLRQWRRRWRPTFCTTARFLALTASTCTILHSLNRAQSKIGIREQKRAWIRKPVISCLAESLPFQSPTAWREISLLSVSIVKWVYYYNIIILNILI